MINIFKMIRKKLLGNRVQFSTFILTKKKQKKGGYIDKNNKS